MNLNQANLVVGGFFIISFLIIFIILFITLYQKRYYRYQREKQIMQNQFQNELLKTQLETQEHSFEQISQELHDNIGQLLSSTKLLLGITTREMKTPPDTLKTAEQTVSKAIVDLRSLSKSLNSEWLHQFNLIQNLEAEKDRINTARNIEVKFISQYDNLPLEPEAQVILFRVVQEALQNSIKHASPKQIIVQVKNINNYFELKIEDDGCGFDVASAKRESLGMRNMQHRTTLLGGTIEWSSNKEKGTVITITIPVKKSK